MAEQDGVDIQVSEQDSPPADATDGEKSTDRGFADHPRFKEIMSQRNEARAQFETANSTIAELQEEIAKLKESKSDTAEPTDDISGLLESLYPEIREKIFQDAQKMEAERLEAERLQKELEAKQQQELEEQTNVIIEEVRSEFSSDKDWDAFVGFLQETIEIYPNATLDSALKDYKKRGLMPKKGQTVSKGSGGGKAPSQEFAEVSRKEDFVSAAVRGLKEKGLK
jgi:chromosome segregation ATPase